MPDIDTAPLRTTPLPIRVDAVQQLAEPCWVLRLPDGAEPDHGAWPDSHYATEEAAAKDAADLRDDYDPPRVLIPVRLESPCFEARAACGYRYDEDDEGFQHALKREWLVDGIRSAGWKPVVGGGMTCGGDGCDECNAMTVIAATAEMPGQIALIGGDDE